MSAIPDYKNYETWKPQTNNTLDLRLAIFESHAFENNLIAQKAEEMGEHLERLYTQSSYISEEGWKKLLSKCPNLKILNLNCAYKVDDSVLEILAGFKKLEELNLSFASNIPTYETNGYAVRIPENRDMSYVTDVGVAAILKGCPSLRKLDLSGTQITNKTLHLIQRKKNITFLRVQDCIKLEMRGCIMATIISKDKNDDPSLSYGELAKHVKQYFSKDRLSSEKDLISIHFLEYLP